MQHEYLFFIIYACISDEYILTYKRLTLAILSICMLARSYEWDQEMSAVDAWKVC
jgi:hypothetical protein